MKQTRLKAKLFNKELEHAGYELKISKKDSVESVEDKEQGLKLILINNNSAFFYYKERLIPTLKFLQTHPDLLKKIIVDMGAIKFVAGGADIMRPGITKINPEIKEGDIIAIVDETHGQAICIGKAILNAEDMETQKTGKSLENIHYINDIIWKFS